VLLLASNAIIIKATIEMRQVQTALDVGHRTKSTREQSLLLFDFDDVDLLQHPRLHVPAQKRVVQLGAVGGRHPFYERSNGHLFTRQNGYTVCLQLK